MKEITWFITDLRLGIVTVHGRFFFVTKGKFRKRNYYSLQKIKVCTNSFAVHGLKITTNECAQTEFFVKNAVL